MLARATRLLASLLFSVILALPALAREQAPRAPQNPHTIGLVSGGVAGTYVRIASDLAAVLDRENELRILPILGKGSVQNIHDLLYMKGVDGAIVQSDVLAYIRANRIHANIEQRIRYVAKLYNEEFHLLAAQDVTRIEDLRGRKVNFDVKGSGTFLTATTVFGLLGIEIEATAFDQALALEKLKAGEIAAMVYVAGKPTELFRTVEQGAGLHFVSIPLSAELLDTYLPSTLRQADYPRLVPEDKPIETIAVGAVLAVYNWDRGTERFRRMDRFVQAFFDRFAEFQKPPRHAKWQEVNLAATLPGWVRFPSAEDWLRARTMPTVTPAEMEMRTTFEAFLKFVEQRQVRIAETDLSEQQRSELFQQFQQWQRQQKGAQP
jgi:TRAP transporter TAXI family solute receptor